MTKNCEQCGTAFQVNPRVGARQKFCNRLCGKKAAPSTNRGRRNPWVSRPCRHCGQTFERLSAEGGARRYCTDECKRAAASARIYDQRWKHVARRYGIQPDAFEAMLARQGGECAVCSRPLAGRALDVDSPQVDHDHDTGKLRAILCRPCNTALGMFRDDPDLVDRAAEYLRFWALVHRGAQTNAVT